VERGGFPAWAYVEESLSARSQPEGDKRTIIEHLSKAKTFVENVAATGGLVKAGEMIRKFF
jgi:hypothetical protein